MFKYCLNGIGQKLKISRGLFNIAFPMQIIKRQNLHNVHNFHNLCFKSFSQHQTANEIKEQDNEEEPQLRQIQLNPRYEAAVGFFVTGDYERAIKSLNELKRSICDDNMQISEDYLFLLKKLVSFHKINKDVQNSLDILKEIKVISLKLYRSDFNYLFENLEYVIINLTNFDPSQAIEFTNSILEEKLLPNFFDHIFKYYLGSAYILEGKYLEQAVDTFNSMEKDLDDKYIKACVYNNKACAIWWSTMNKHIQQIKSKKGVTLELVESIAKEMFKVVKIFKEALISIENIEGFKYEDKYVYQSNLPKENQKINFLKFFLSVNFDTSIKIDPVFLKEFGETKESITDIKTSAIIFSNLGELYYNIRDYKKSLIALNAANLFFQNYSKNDPLFYKNLSLIAMNNWKLTNKSEGPKQMFEKILSHIKQFGFIYEKVFIFRIYGEMILEESSQNVLGNNLMEEANKMEEKIPFYECRRIYMTLPSES